MGCSHHHLRGIAPPSLSLAPLAFVKDWTGRYVLRDRLPTNQNMLSHRLHPAFLQHILRPWIYPHPVRSPLGLVFLSHPGGAADVEPLKPRQGGFGEDPRFAAVKEEDGLDHRLMIAPGSNERRDILAPEHLPDAGPSSTGLATGVTRYQ